VKGAARYALAPVLLALYPSVFLYSQNAQILTLRSLRTPILICILVAVACYMGASLLLKGDHLAASNATLAFLPFFLVYGAIYELLLRADLIMVMHQTLLPALLVTGGYGGYLASRMREPAAGAANGILLLILGGLVTLNALGIAAAEVVKAYGNQEGITPLPTPQALSGEQVMPDIYYIVLDEYACFEAIRDYWGYVEIASFEEFLERRGFFVANNSRSRTKGTLVEMAARLNFEEFAADLEPKAYFDAIANNRAMQDLRSIGYVTIVYDGMRSPLFYPAKRRVEADLVLERDPAAENGDRLGFIAAIGPAISIDPFGEKMLDLTMLRPMFESALAGNDLSGRYTVLRVRHIAEVLWAFERLASLESSPSPRFVYAHIMLPHEPFVFDAQGRVNRAGCFEDWGCYLGNYVFATKLVRQLVEAILRESKGGPAPVIILQSDHGARNQPYMEVGGVLEAYPEAYKNCILNAMLLPGIDSSHLPEDLDPINTFPLILNSYFGYDIPLE